MAKKLEGNGMWESSRMILPQHKDLILNYQKEELSIPRPTLDEQEIDAISTALVQSQVYKKSVDLTLYGEYQLRSVTGIVTRR
jgi:hypothetical protein